MGVGKREKITFKEITVGALPSGSHTESYTSVLYDWAVVSMKNKTRVDAALQTQIRTVYEFSEIRQRVGFEPTKTMQILYGGLELQIETIVLNTNTLPYYYKITASLDG